VSFCPIFVPSRQEAALTGSPRCSRASVTRFNFYDQLPNFHKIWYKCYTRPAQPVARGQHAARDTVLCRPRRHLKWAKVFLSFTWQSQNRTPKQFWKLTSCLFMETCTALLIHFVKMWSKERHTTQGYKLRSFTSFYYQWSIFLLHMNMRRKIYRQKYTYNYIYTYSFVIVYWIPCFPHADKILPKLPLPHERLSRPVLQHEKPPKPVKHERQYRPLTEGWISKSNFCGIQKGSCMKYKLTFSCRFDSHND
jgi:hypothetical protein